MTDRRRGLLARVTFATLALLAIGWTPACAKVLGLDEELEDAVLELCQCNEGDPVPDFGGNCEEVLEERLSMAAEQTRERWLAYYVDNCGGGCPNAFSCFQQDPTCSYTTCNDDRECCGFAAGNQCGTSGCVDPDGNPL